MQKDQRSGMEALAFKLGEEEYGINLLKVREIRGYGALTKIANAPDFIKGVINPRGIVVPIVDMRMKFNPGMPPYDQFTVVVVLDIADQAMGIVVDSVSDVVTLSPEQIKPAPETGAALNTDYLIGLGAVGGRTVILLDIDRLMASEEIGLVEKLAA